MWFHLDGDRLSPPTLFRRGNLETLFSEAWTNRVVTNTLSTHHVTLWVDGDGYRWQVLVGASVLFEGEYRGDSIPRTLGFMPSTTRCVTSRTFGSRMTGEESGCPGRIGIQGRIWAGAMGSRGNGVSPVELTFEACFEVVPRKGLVRHTFGAVHSCRRLGFCLKAFWGEGSGMPSGSRGGVCRVCERWRKAVSSDGNSVLLRLSVIFAAILAGLRRKGLTRRREDAKGKGACVCRSAKTLLAASDCWRSHGKGFCRPSGAGFHGGRNPALTHWAIV